MTEPKFDIGDVVHLNGHNTPMVVTEYYKETGPNQHLGVSFSSPEQVDVVWLDSSNTVQVHRFDVDLLTR